MICSHHVVGAARRGTGGGRVPAAAAPDGCASCESSASGTAISGPSRKTCCTPTISGEMTPTMVIGVLLKRTTLPMTCGSLPNRFRQ